ncbi:MAG: hypothetical protein GXP25_23150 [Planctomycetes bacterium]|nr:hypothetical protein [Planctomycetota bacterium]
MRPSWQLRIPMVLIMLWIGYRVGFSRTSGQAHSVFSGIDLGIHELGHVVTCWLPNLLCALAGTVAQCVAPLIAAFSFFRKGILFETCFCIWWSGENMICSSYYIADAKSMDLPLVTPFGGEAHHDWNYILRTVGLLRWDTTLAFFVRAGGTLLVLGGIAAGIAVLWAMRERDLGRRPPGPLGGLTERE